MSDEQRPHSTAQIPALTMPPMSGNQRPPDYRKEILEGGQRQPGLNFTEEDKLLMNKINSDSFYQRSLPLFILGSGSVFLASHRGLINKGVKAKAFIAGFTGFMFGKFSYASEMQERFLKELPYSEVSQMIRKSRGMPEIEIPPPASSSEDDLSYIQSKPEEPYVLNPSDNSPSGRGMSYEELRQQHQKRYTPVQDKEPGFFIPQHELARMEAGQNQPIWSNPQPSDMPITSTRKQPEVSSPPPSSSDLYGQKMDEQPRRKITNKYGDEIYE